MLDLFIDVAGDLKSERGQDNVQGHDNDVADGRIYYLHRRLLDFDTVRHGVVL